MFVVPCRFMCACAVKLEVGCSNRTIAGAWCKRHGMCVVVWGWVCMGVCGAVCVGVHRCVCGCVCGCGCECEVVWCVLCV